MAHFIPTLRNVSRPTYTTPAMRRRADNPSSTTVPAAPADFRTVLKSQSGTTTATTAPATTAAATVATTAAATTAALPAAAASTSTPGTIGTVTPRVPEPAQSVSVTAYVMAPTAQTLFGANPWQSNASGTGPNGNYAFNPSYFATPSTAAKVAEMLGGTVVAMDAITPYGPFQQDQPNLMVRMPDGRMANAGLVAGFYNNGYTQEYVDRMIAAELNGTLV